MSAACLLMILQLTCACLLLSPPASAIVVLTSPFDFREFQHRHSRSDSCMWHVACANGSRNAVRAQLSPSRCA